MGSLYELFGMSFHNMQGVHMKKRILIARRQRTKKGISNILPKKIRGIPLRVNVVKKHSWGRRSSKGENDVMYIY